MLKYKIEKVPSPVCDTCGSSYVTMTDKGLECDDCERITAQTSDYMKKQKRKLEKLILTSN